MEQIKKILKNIKFFCIAVGRTVRKGAKKIFSPNIKTGLRGVGRMLGAVLGVAGRIALTMVLIALLTATIVGVFGAIYITRYLDVDTNVDLGMYKLNLSSHIYVADPDNPDNWLEVETLSSSDNRVRTTYDELPAALVDAVVAIEDKRFWQHDGVDWKRTAGGFLSMITGGDQYGGSTITQQLVRMITQDKDVTVARKLNEIFRALAFERKYPGQEGKELILEEYLNTIPLGNRCSGVVTAAETYFNKTLDELTLAECALLAGITNNPSYYNPFTHPKNAKRRQEVILGEMYNQQIISRHEYNVAKYQPLVYARRSGSGSTNLRSWYIDQVLVDVKNDLMTAYGYSNEFATDYIFSGGLHIYANMDVRIQKILDDVWADPERWPATPDAEPPESAMMIVDHHTGQIKAMIGGREKSGDLVRNNATMMKRQPGSSFKPVAVYTPAFEQGLITPYTPIDDMPLRAVDGRGWPRNSPARYDGRISVISAITQSKNAVSVRVLEQLTYPQSFRFATERLGISTLVESKQLGSQTLTDIDASPLAFGALTDGVTVRDMAGAYSAMANDNGIRHDTRTYSHVADSEGVTVLDSSAGSVTAMKEKTAYYIRTCLINAVASGTGGRASFEGMPVAGKTGTTTANKDRWFAGFTPYYTAVCWFGYLQPREMSFYNSINPAVHMWQQVMEQVHEGLERREFYVPEGLVQYTYCVDSGLPASDLCRLDPRGSRVATGYLYPEDVPKTRCNVHTKIEICTLSNHLATEFCPQEFRKEIALLNINRHSPVPGLSLPDEQYTLPAWIRGVPVPDTLYPVIAVGTDGAKPLNAYCDLHTSPVLPSPDPSAEPTDPNAPDTSGDGDPWADPSPPETPAESPPDAIEPSPSVWFGSDGLPWNF
ncbi:MAG: transglycosylase domain-containing protein [Oscillospiraceae bacterium]|jgi:penicillin-binding protein 1A|nr:transglycosylase domain-containing protein [Oscillospiraceae bacterium]